MSLILDQKIMRTSILFQGAGRAVVIIVLSFLFQFGLEAEPRPHFQITSLGTLPGGGDVMPVALNNHGQVVGRAQDSTGYFRAFLFRDGNMSQLAIPNAGAVFCINDNGEIVAQAIIDQYYRSFFITPQGIVDLDAQTGWNVWPAGLNNDGVIAGSISRGLIPEAITWSNGMVRYLGYIDPAHGSYAQDINNRGEVLSGFYLESPPGPAVVTAIMRDGAISVLGTFYGVAINDRGHVAGTDQFGGLHAFLYRPDGSLLLGALPGDYYSYARKINNTDQIIGESEDGSDHRRPFFYSDGAIYDLNDLIPHNSGWTLSFAADINDRGQIVGWGFYRGQQRGFLLTPLKKLRLSHTSR